LGVDLAQLKKKKKKNCKEKPKISKRLFAAKIAGARYRFGGNGSIR